MFGSVSYFHPSTQSHNKMYNDQARNDMIDALAGNVGFISLHTAYSITGANEVSGGSPAYARKAVTWGAAANGEAVSITVSQVFDVPSGTTVLYTGMWSLATGGIFYGMFPVSPTLVGQVEAESDDETFYRFAHGYVNNDRIGFFGDNLPVGITEGIIYHVINASVDTFQISTVQGGSAILISADGEAIAAKTVPEVFAGQGQYTLAIGGAKISLNLISSS